MFCTPPPPLKKFGFSNKENKCFIRFYLLYTKLYIHSLLLIKFSFHSFIHWFIRSLSDKSDSLWVAFVAERLLWFSITTETLSRVPVKPVGENENFHEPEQENNK